MHAILWGVLGLAFGALAERKLGAAPRLSARASVFH
jgi:hypothetical protein